MKSTLIYCLLPAVALVAGTSAQASPVLIAYWDFNQTAGTDLPIVAGDANLAGTLQGTDDNLPTWTDGKLGGALYFGGGTTGEHVVIGSNNNVTNLSGPKTFSFWTKLGSGNTTNHGYIGIDKDTSNRWYVDSAGVNTGHIRMYNPHVQYERWQRW